MTLPTIVVTPLYPVLPSNSPTVLDVVVKIVPPELAPGAGRPQLNVGLVIDRSSSMSVKDRLTYAKAAARQLVHQLSPSDRISITVFDRTVQTLIPSTLATDKASIIAAIQDISTGKWTNLHAGWLEGGCQVNQHCYTNTINRVILLSDGWASAGITNTTKIVQDVNGLAASGISTTTMGVGSDYHEDLLQAMAINGDGNYYYINTPDRILATFQQEMQALVATIGSRVDLGIEVQNNVDLVEILNDLPVTPQGRFQLPNLIAGYPFSVVMRLNVPALTQDTDLCVIRLGWVNPQQRVPEVMRVPFRMPVASDASTRQLPRNPEVQQYTALMLAARLKKAAIACVDQKCYSAAQEKLASAKATVLKAPTSELMEAEIIAIESLEANLRNRQLLEFRKQSHYEAHEVTQGFTQPGCSLNRFQE